jgi:hypothetical protein
MRGEFLVRYVVMKGKIREGSGGLCDTIVGLWETPSARTSFTVRSADAFQTVARWGRQPPAPFFSLRDFRAGPYDEIACSRVECYNDVLGVCSFTHGAFCVRRMVERIDVKVEHVWGGEQLAGQPR